MIKCTKIVAVLVTAIDR